MFCWIFYDVNSEHLGQSESFPTIDAAVGWLQKQAEADLPDVDVDADIARLVVVKHVKIHRKVQLIGLPELVAAGAVSPQPETAPAPAPAPRRGRKLAVVPAPADIADQVPQSEPEPAVTELAGVMAGDVVEESERRYFGGIEINTKPVHAAELTPRTPAEAEATIARIEAEIAEPVSSAAVVDAVKDRLLRTGKSQTEAQLAAYVGGKLRTAGINIAAVLDALAEDGTLLAAGITRGVDDGAVTYSLKQPESAPEPEPTPTPTTPREPWEVICNGVVVELRIGDVWSHQVYQQPTAASTVAERLRGHMASGATGPASVAQRFLPGRAPAAPEL